MNEGDQSKEIEEIRNSDLSPAMLARESAPKKTWFFERGRPGDHDYMIFPCEEREAWDIINNRSEWKRRDFRMIGVSDGTTYQKVVKESITDAKRLEPEITKLKDELGKYMQAEEKLLINEAVDMQGDPSDTTNEENKKKVLRLQSIIARLNGEIAAKEKEYRECVSDVVKRATAAELEVARGHIEWPSEMNIITPDASPRERAKILKVMGQQT